MDKLRTGASSMLTILGAPRRFCDGLPRRDFLKIGSLALGGISLPQMLRAEAATGSRRSHKAVIMIYLSGGPPHQDTFDLKPDAPAEVRGEFKPIATNVPGIQVCEVFPKLARMMDQFAVIRSIVGAKDGHDAYQCTTGYEKQSLAAIGGRPSIGSALAKLQGAVDPSVPPFVGLAEKTQHVEWSDAGQVG